MGKQTGKVELAGAGLAGGFEVGAGPVAGGVGHFGVQPAGFAAVAVMFVIGEEAGEVAELGGGAGGMAAAAVAAGAEGRAGGDEDVAHPMPSPPWSSGLNLRAASALSRTCSVFRIETQHDENRSSVQIACKRPW